MAYRQAFSVRQRMLDCIQHLEYYMMVEVIEPNWLTFINKMGKVLKFLSNFIRKVLQKLIIIIYLRSAMSMTY